MKKIRPIFLVEFSSPILSGGNRRTFEILKHGKSENIDFIILTSLISCQNAVKMFPNYLEVLSKYRVYIKNFKEVRSNFIGVKQIFAYINMLHSVLSLSKIAFDNEAEIIVGSEEAQILLSCYFAGRFSSIPWTVVWQPGSDLYQPSTSKNLLIHLIYSGL